jgi:hypothetical protein
VPGVIYSSRGLHTQISNVSTGDVEATSAARAFKLCLAAFLKEQWQDAAPIELDEATV